MSDGFLLIKDTWSEENDPEKADCLVQIRFLTEFLYLLDSVVNKRPNIRVNAVYNDQMDFIVKKPKGFFKSKFSKRERFITFGYRDDMTNAPEITKDKKHHFIIKVPRGQGKEIPVEHDPVPEHNISYNSYQGQGPASSQGISGIGYRGGNIGVTNKRVSTKRPTEAIGSAMTNRMTNISVAPRPIMANVQASSRAGGGGSAAFAALQNSTMRSNQNQTSQFSQQSNNMPYGVKTYSKPQNSTQQYQQQNTQQTDHNNNSYGHGGQGQGGQSYGGGISLPGMAEVKADYVTVTPKLPPPIKPKPTQRKKCRAV